MKATLQRAKEVLSDPDSAMTEKVHYAGVLAIAVVAAGMSGPEIEEARAMVVAFWRESEAAR